MHTYPNYHAPDGRSIVDFVARTPFAIAMTSQEGAPIATHVPVVLPPGLDTATIDSWIGTTLWSHMGYANRHWRLFEQQPELLLIHSSTHGYVSPTLYHSDPSVPTVDYTAVHLTGSVRLMHSESEALEVVEQTVRQLEATRDPQWDMTGSLNTFRSIIGGVKAFAIDITAEQAVFKLSQDMSPEIRSHVRAEFGGEAEPSTSGCLHADLARLMDSLPPEHVRHEHYPPAESE